MKSELELLLPEPLAGPGTGESRAVLSGPWATLPRSQASAALTHAGLFQAPEESPKPLALALVGPQPSPGLPPSSQDRTCEIVEDAESSRMVKKMKKRICLVLDCLCAHDFSDKTADLINLQHYVIKEKRLSERETVVIFYDVVRVVEALHQVSLRPCSSHLLSMESRPSCCCSVEAALSHPHPGVLCSWEHPEGKWPEDTHT